MAMKRRGAGRGEPPQMIGSAIAFVPGEAVLRIDEVPFFHASVTMSFGEDGSRGDGNTPGIAFDEGFLLDEDIELHGVDEQVIRLDRKLLESGGHGLAAGLVDVPGVDSLSIDFGDCPGERMLADAGGKFQAAL